MQVSATVPIARRRPAQCSSRSWALRAAPFASTGAPCSTQRRRRTAGMRCAIPVRSAAAWCSGPLAFELQRWGYAARGWVLPGSFSKRAGRRLHLVPPDWRDFNHSIAATAAPDRGTNIQLLVSGAAVPLNEGACSGSQSLFLAPSYIPHLSGDDLRHVPHPTFFYVQRLRVDRIAPVEGCGRCSKRLPPWGLFRRTPDRTVRSHKGRSAGLVRA